MAGLVPAIPLREPPCSPNRDRRDKPGDDDGEGVELVGKCLHSAHLLLGSPDKRLPESFDFALDEIIERPKPRRVPHVLMHEQEIMGHQPGDAVNHANKIGLSLAKNG